MIDIKRVTQSAILLLLSCCIPMFANDSDKEEHIASLFKEVFDSKSDSVRIAMAEMIMDEFQDVVNNADKLDTALFVQLKNVGKITAQDNSLRLYTWNIPLSDGKSLFYAIFKSYETGKAFTLGKTRNISPKDGIFNENNWYGALYYELIPFKYGNEDKKAYLAFGWAPGSTVYTNCKMIEVIVIDDNSIQFGAPVIYDEKYERTFNRLTFEYYRQSLFSIEYDKRKKRVVFNHLAPLSNTSEGRQVLIPDESFDAIVFKKGMWLMQEDTNVKNKREKR